MRIDSEHGRPWDELEPVLRRAVSITPAQNRVLAELLNDGASNHTIARRLGLRYDTVKTHMRAILDRFGLDTRTAVAVELLRGQASVRVERHRPGPPMKTWNDTVNGRPRA